MRRIGAVRILQRRRNQAWSVCRHPPLTHRSNPDVSREFEEVLRHTVVCDPSQRYQTAGALRQALEQVTGSVVKRILGWLKVS